LRAGLGVALRIAGVLRIARILSITGNRSLISGSIRLLCIARIGRLVGSRIGLLSIAGVLGETGIRSLIKSDIGMRDIVGIRSLFGSRGKMELLSGAGMGSPVGCGNRSSLLGIGGVGRPIEGRNWMVLLGVAWMGNLIGSYSWIRRLIGLLDGPRLRARSVMAGGRLWLGRLGILAGSVLRLLLHGLLCGDCFGQRYKKKRQGDDGNQAGMPRGPGKTQNGLGFHALLSEPDGAPEAQCAFQAAGGILRHSTEVRAASVDPKPAR
jgi:hypothetical protein